METLTNEFKAEAAKYNCYPINGIPKFYFDDEYFKKRFNFENEKETRIIIPESLKKCKFESGIFAQINEEHNNDGSHRLYYVDHFRILIFDGSNVVQLLEYKGKFFLHPMYKDINLLTRNLNHSNYGPYTDKIAEPNRIGVFTDKKLTDWFEYCRNYIQALQQCKGDNENKTKANLKRIEDVATALGVEPKGHSTYKYIQLKNIEIRFELLDNGNHLKETVVFTGKVDDVVDMFGKTK